MITARSGSTAIVLLRGAIEAHDRLDLLVAVVVGAQEEVVVEADVPLASASMCGVASRG